MCSSQMEQSPMEDFTILAHMWHRAMETEIGSTLCGTLNSFIRKLVSYLVGRM